ncbi:hypothetical protein BH11MYX1_BH11MYX1_30860 [soil metagenome]
MLDGRYRIIKLIGEGGMGEVYSAEHVHIDKKFAIKLLKQEIVSNAEAVTRFRQEARSSSSIGHRNIIAIEDFGQLSDGRIYMCMELLNGAALNDMIQQPMSADRLLNILIQTGHGLAAAHAKGIVHRDMKPENIFVTIGPQNEDVPKILDFGIAKVAGNEGGNHLTRTGTIFGTPFYMAPEQALGNPVDQRTDIYAMGVIMYECFAGSLPFQGESFMGILTQHITSEPEPVTQRAQKAGRALPLGLADIITRCMQKNPAQRFSSMDELVTALVAVYRGIAGAGMSTYMEAFPVGSPGHSNQPTPPPMHPPAGSYGTPQTGGYPPVQSSGPQNFTPMPVAAQQSQPAMHPGLYDPSASVVHVAKKSSAGLIIGIILLLAAGGGIAAFVLMSNKNKPADGGGSGSALVAAGSGGSDTAGSAAATTVGSGSAGSAATVAPDKGSDTTVPTREGSGSAVVAEVPPPFDVRIDCNAPGFEVLENNVPVTNGILAVRKGDTRTVTVRAVGFKDKSVTIYDKNDSTGRISVRLEPVKSTRIPTVHNGSDSPIPNPNNKPDKADCSRSVVNLTSECRKQFCKFHPDDSLHGCDTE